MNKWFFSTFLLLLSLVAGYFIGGVTALLAVLWLCVLEVSLSFENAVINAKILKHMPPIWQKRFLVWGLLIAVVFMRLLLPLLIVSLVAWISPWEAARLALFEKSQYASILHESRIPIYSFGASFLMLTSLSFFLDKDKTTHWLPFLEKALSFLGRVKIASFSLISILIVLVVLFAFSTKISHDDYAHYFLGAFLGGLVFFLLTYFTGSAREFHKATPISLFIYLEILDSSFSFDGVIGAFAISKNIFVIAIGLAVGALFVRSFTLSLVEKGTLSNLRYLENGAFWGVLGLSFSMLFGTFTHVPEVVSGGVCALLVALSYLSSLWVQKRKNGAENEI